MNPTEPPAPTAPPPAPPAPAGTAGTAVADPSADLADPARSTVEHVVSINRWTDRLVSFRTTRDPAFRYLPGLYARLGLHADRNVGAALWRAFSMVSAPHEPTLEFVATLVDRGPFSARLARCAVGDPIRVACAAYGFLTLGQLAPGRDLWLIASGTGLGPFVSMLRDGQTRRLFEHRVVVHSVRHAADLAYRDEIERLAAGPRGAGAPGGLCYLPVVTREAVAGPLDRRVPELLRDGRLEAAAGLPLDVAHARVMVCGHPELTAAMRAALAERGLRASRRGVPGQMAFEKYW